MNYEVRTFKHGLLNRLEQQSIPAGAASSTLNWITMGDHIELRRGYRLLGTDAGAGRVTGLHVGVLNDGTEQMWRTRGKKLEYYDNATLDWVEVGTNQLGTAADGEDVTFANYSSLAGDQAWLCSPNSSVYKMLVANPGSVVDQYNSAKNFKGRINIKQNRMFLWGRTADKTGLYGSYIDIASYTTVTAEVLGTGDAIILTFAGTLAFKGGGSKRTCFALAVTGSTETFTDNYRGGLVGSNGGTGTINYATGAISVTFASAPTGSVTVDYQWEDSTNNGIADFTKSATRTAGQGFVFRQDDGGGDLQSVFSYGDTEYCFHKLKTWALTLGRDDTTATNLIYRSRVGISYFRGGTATGDGVWYVDDLDKNNQAIRILQLETGSTEVIPVPKSNNLDLADYLFDKAAGQEFGNLVLIACRTTDVEYNNRVLVYNKLWGSWDVIDYFVSCFVVFEGALLAGDSLSNNVYELLSGVDDDDSLIPNFWEGHLSDLEIADMKKSRRFVVEGTIGADQIITVSLAYDRGAFVQIGTVAGDGAYVDRDQAVTVGATTVGRPELGGGGSGLTAYHFKREFKLDTSKFSEVKVRFEATQLGWASVTMYRFQDIIRKNNKIAQKYRA